MNYKEVTINEARDFHHPTSSDSLRSSGSAPLLGGGEILLILSEHINFFSTDSSIIINSSLSLNLKLSTLN
jgi:hypothetical protein